MKNILFLGFLFLFQYSYAQEKQIVDKGALQLHAGTLHIYRTFSIGYESPTLFQLKAKHQFRIALNGGLWTARLFNPNKGSQINSRFIYLFGEKRHKLELNAGLTIHFDSGLKGQLFTYIGTLPTTFLGYRYENLEKKFFLKAGIGWYEALQIGFGYRF